MMNIIFIVFGIIMVLWGAGKLTDGATSLAARMNIPPIVIGLTVVAMGTSMPEFFISFISALKGTTDLAVGNVVGSNIFNTMLIVGTAALVAPMTILRSTVKKDIPFTILASAMLIPMTLDGDISRLDAALLFLVFIVFMVYTVRSAKNGTAEGDKAEAKQMPVWQAIAFFFLGLAAKRAGGNAQQNGGGQNNGCDFYGE